MNPTNRLSRFHQAGFTLVELMVGLAIGMLATVVIIQVMSVFDAQRRTTTGSADAQTNGGIALNAIARDVQLGGYPLFPADQSALECTSLAVGSTGITANVSSLSPVTITEGVATTSVSASDSITIRYGTSATGGIPSQITAIGGTVLTLNSNLGCEVNDITLASLGTGCAMSKVTAKSAAAATPITVTLQDALPGALNSSDTKLACLGAWNEITYAVNPTTGNLDRTSKISGVIATTPSFVVGVVNLQVQYGIATDSTNKNKITQWVNATGGTWAAPTVNDRKLIKAIRIAVVARNEKLEPTAVTKACSSTSTAALARLCAWDDITGSPAPTIDLSQGDANWARYRYRVFETIIPIRNVIWAKETL
jgi:type IV pilus assembly protein PilW